MAELYTPEVCYDLSMRTPRFFSVAVLAVLLSALAGGFFGSSAQATQDQVSQQYRVFTAALAAIDREYVEAAPVRPAVYDAIGGMLQTLDPIPASSPQALRADARAAGRQVLRHRALDPGDRRRHHRDVALRRLAGVSRGHPPRRRHRAIVKRRESAKNWTTEQTAKQLKGPKGTKVNIAIRRPGYDKLIDMDVERDEVNIVTVRGVFMIDPTTGSNTEPNQ